MNEINRPITFLELIRRCSRIEVPLIQRDYAQGRTMEKEVRDHFLVALYDALALSSSDPRLPLNLDFVYGTIEKSIEPSFLPLDGQQRLTTLFLLHWYLAWRDDQLPHFQSLSWDGQHSRFTYGVRPSSSEFFDELIRFLPQITPDEIPILSKLLEDQAWYFLHWRLDPTIQSALVMLDAIHSLFKSTRGHYARLSNDVNPAVTFQLLPLENFGLTDDLYIKMNARGKPLTTFETFKARFEEHLKEIFPIEKRTLGKSEVSVAAYFERQIDTQWTDLFWAYKNKKTNTFDDVAMNVLIAMARVSLEPASSSFGLDTVRLRLQQQSITFSTFHERGWLTSSFACNLINLLDAWSRGRGRLSPVLLDSRYFNEDQFFNALIQDPSALDYTQLTVFAAFVFYLRNHGSNVQPESLNEWMRVVCNLAKNSDIERPEEYSRCLAGLHKLLPYSAIILEHFATTEVGQIGFSQIQVREEVLKAKLLRSSSSWRSQIDRAEAHGYFTGQIEFLLEFSGICGKSETSAISDWLEIDHSTMRQIFDNYLSKATLMFGPTGLAVTDQSFGKHLWKRALLSVGNYLIRIGSNYSFLTDHPKSGDSWKRFLRSGGSGNRIYLKALWDRMNLEVAVAPQLSKIINSASDVEMWRSLIVTHPEVLDYCVEQEIRWELNTKEIYLLSKRQMNGMHAELFSYALYLDIVATGSLGLAPLKSPQYCSVSVTDVEPKLLFAWDHLEHRLEFFVDAYEGRFRIFTNLEHLEKLPEVTSALQMELNFLPAGWALLRTASRDEIASVLQQLIRCLKALTR